MSKPQGFDTSTDNLIGEANMPHNEHSKVAYQYADVNIPVQLNPNVTIGDIEIECCDEPIVNCCNNDSQQACDVIVTQKVRIKIPICYEIDACAGKSFINCNLCASCK